MFGGSNQKPGGFTFSQPTTTVPTSGFNFGSSTSSSGFTSFNVAATKPSATSGSGFTFGASSSSAGGFTFGTKTTPVSSNPGAFAFSGATPAPSQSIQLSATESGVPATKETGGFGFGSALAAGQPAAMTGQGFAHGLSVSAATTASSLSTLLSVPAASTTTAAASVTALGGMPAFSTRQMPSSSGGFSFGSAFTSSTTPAYSSQPVAAVSGTAGPSFTLSASTSSSAATAAPLLGSVVGTLKPVSVASGSGMSVPSSSTSRDSTTTAVTVSTAADSTGVSQQMTYRQLEEATNRWMSELETQEQKFLLQATQINAWDRLIIENGEQIVHLNTDLERLNLEQQRLDHELDFVSGQQRELSDILTPLESALESMPDISYQQHADLERESTYRLAESLDAQLKRMSQDLKEIIDRINSSNAKPDTDSPIQQITKILDTHMNSLMWVDRQTGNLQRRTEELSKTMEGKQEKEPSFPLAYR